MLALLLPDRIGDFVRGRWCDLEPVAPSAGWSVAYHQTPPAIPGSLGSRPATATVYVYPSPMAVHGVETDAALLLPQAGPTDHASGGWHEWASGRFLVMPFPAISSMTGRHGATSITQIDGEILKVRISASSEHVAVDGVVMLTRALLRHLYAGSEH
jgi:hypothetical protein